MEGRVDRYACFGREDSQKRGNSSSQLDTMKESAGVEKEMEGRVDRYASVWESHASHSKDSEHGGKSTSSFTYDWRKPHRTSSAHGLSWNPPFLSSGTTAQDPRLQGQIDGSGNSQSPLISPYSGSSQTVEIGHDDAVHLSPPKRPRLGWGQGLAKYEKKKVGDVEVVAKPAAVHKGEVTLRTESHTEQESSCERLQMSVGPTDIPSNEITTPSNDRGARKAEQVLGEDDHRTISSLEGESTGLIEVAGTPGDRAINTGTVGLLSPSLTGTDRVAVAQHQVTDDVDETTSEARKGCRDEDLLATVSEGVIDCSSGWTKEAILLKVEKVESEIDLVEKELARLLAEGEGQPSDKVGRVPDQGIGSSVLEGKIQQANAAVEHIGEEVHLHAQSPFRDSFMTDVAHEKESQSVVASPCDQWARLPDSDAAHSATLRSEDVDGSSEGSGETEEGDALKEITNDMQSDQSWPPAKDTQLKVLSKDQSPCDSTKMGVSTDQRAFVNALLENNRKIAMKAEAPLSILLFRNSSQGRARIYNSPADAPVWSENMESHLKNQLRMQRKLTERKKQLRFKERALALKYRVLKDECKHGGLGICQRRDRVKSGRRWEVDRRSTSAHPLPPQRSALRLRPAQVGPPRLLPIQDEGHTKKRFMTGTAGTHFRQDLQMPSMIIDDKEKSFHRFVNTNGLVEDPVGFEQSRKAVNPWTSEEKKNFLEKFNVYYKDFGKIASFLEHKTTADCVEYYYRNQKSEDLGKVKRRHQLLKRKKESIPASSSYLATASAGIGRNHRDANDSRVQALTLAALAASRDCSKALRVSSHRVHEKSRIIAKHVVANLESWVPNTGSIKECKSQINLEASTSGISTGMLGAAATFLTKYPSEKLSTRTEFGHLTPNTKAGPSDQPSIIKGMRTILHREPVRVDGEMSDTHWTDAERELFTEAVAKFGKEFKGVADHVGTKSQSQCKTFFTKYRKRFKLDELVEQVADASELVLGLLGVKAEASTHHKAQNLVETIQSSSVESARNQAQGVDATEEEYRSNTADVIVGVDALMLLGEAKEMQSLPVSDMCGESLTAVPPSEAELSTVLETVSQVSGPSSDVSDLHIDGFEAAPIVPDGPSTVPTLLSHSSSGSLSKFSNAATNPADPVSIMSDLSLKFDEPQLTTSDHQVSDAVEVAKVFSSPPAIPGSAVVFPQMPSSSPASTALEVLPHVAAGMTKSTSVVGAHDSQSLKVVSKKIVSSSAAKHPHPVVKVEQVNDDALAPDGVMVRQEEGAINGMRSLESEAKAQEPITLMSRSSREDADGQGSAQTVEKPSQPPLTLADVTSASVAVKAEVLPPDVGTMASVGSGVPFTTHVVAVPVTSTPLVQVGQPKERGNRVTAPGEFKPRREPTSWTQEEKEKFAEIMRAHGRDWTLLQEKLPAKSLTQIKTYFQNSKAKLGFLPDALVNVPARANATRKRKGEDSETSSNAGSAGQTLNPKMLLASDDVAQKIIANSMMSIGANMVTPVTSGDGLMYGPFTPDFGSVSEDPSNIRDFQSVLRRMCSGNEYPSQSSIPAGLVPLFHPTAFAGAGLQAGPLLSAQKPPQAVVGHVPQQQALPTQAVLQQPISQMTPTQRQALTQVLQQLQQQQQASHMATHQPQQLSHQLQQQVTQMVAAKQQLQQQQQQQHLASQVSKHLQSQLHIHHQQQAIPLASSVHQQQVISRPKQNPTQQPPQAIRVHHQVSQHPTITQKQQQQLLQQKQQLLFQHQQEQRAQHLHHQLQSQKQMQQPQQLQQLQQLHLQFQKEQAQAHQKIQQQAQQQVQQQVQQQIQQQIQHTMGLFRGPIQSFFSDGDSVRQPETLEPNKVATNQPLRSLEDLQVQTQRIAQIIAPQPARSASPSETLRPTDVKLFGKSLLSQPVSSGQHTSGPPTKAWQSVIAQSPAVPATIPSGSLNKGLSKDAMVLNSGFSRTGSTLVSGEGNSQHSWPTSSPGNLELWNNMMGGLQSVAFHKGDDVKSDLNSTQETCLSTRPTREARTSDVEDIHKERLDAQATKDHVGDDATGGVFEEADVLELRTTLPNDHPRVEVDWRNDLLQQNSSDQRSASSIVSGAAKGGPKDIFPTHLWASPRKETNDGNSGTASIGAPPSHLKKLVSGLESDPLRPDGVYKSQPSPAQPLAVNTWPSTLSPAAEPQPVPAVTGFQPANMIHARTGGLAEPSVSSNSEALEKALGGNGQ